MQLSTHNVIQITRSLFNGRKRWFLSLRPRFFASLEMKPPSWPSCLMAMSGISSRNTHNRRNSAH